MARYLVAVSIGPVQSLIGAARRTRDLWCGSWLLSEAARAAALSLHEHQPGCLIFPFATDPAVDLQPQDSPGDSANIANILRADVEAPNSEVIRDLCNEAISAAEARLASIGESQKNRLERSGVRLRDPIWRSQINDLLEGFAAWVEFSSGAGTTGYEDVSRRLGSALAARKATRDFRPCKSVPSRGLPKSSLDGAFETVLPRDLPTGNQLRHRLGLSDGEQLDALGVIKRLAGDLDQFTAWPRIAADSWIMRLTDDQQRDLRDTYEELISVDLSTRVSGNSGIYRAFPFDAQMLFSFRLSNALAGESEGTRRHAVLLDLQTSFQRISRELAKDKLRASEPVPYAAILKADGDHMGALLARATSADQSRSISHALHGFASSVRRIVRECRGHAIYAGGDDVLALVPLDHAIACARTLADEFKESLDPVAVDLSLPSDERPTLSVGLGIGHVMEPMGALRDRAERAERAAKGDSTEAPRNALAIALGVRSGAEVRWRARWTDDQAFYVLTGLTDAFRNDLLPSRAAYGLRAIHRSLAKMNDDGTTDGMRSAEVDRLLDRARSENGSGNIPSDLRRLIQDCAASQPLSALADTLIIARWLSARSAVDLGERR